VNIDTQCKTCAHRTGVTCALGGNVFADNYCGCHERRPPSPAKRKQAIVSALVQSRYLTRVLSDLTGSEARARLFDRAAKGLDKIHALLRIADEGAL
jgi:hypothetical protein